MLQVIRNNINKGVLTMNEGVFLVSEIEVIKELIGSMGFPIFACVIMFYQNQKFSNVLNNMIIEMKAMNNSLNDLKDKLDN